MEELRTWQTEDNSMHYTRQRLCCDGCGKFVERGYHFVEDVENNSRENFGCWNCLNDFLQIFLIEFDRERVLMRGVEDVLFLRRNETKKRVRSEMNLRLRFEIMERDKFSCVLCGNTARESKLEIDHIKPVSAGGTNDKSNLRTVCFLCNRGKGEMYAKQ